VLQFAVMAVTGKFICPYEGLTQSLGRTAFYMWTGRWTRNISRKFNKKALKTYREAAYIIWISRWNTG